MLRISTAAVEWGRCLATGRVVFRSLCYVVLRRILQFEPSGPETGLHLGYLHWRDFHPLERQLASLHSEGEGFHPSQRETLNDENRRIAPQAVTNPPWTWSCGSTARTRATYG